MSLKTLMISALVAYTEARFGQEHPAAIDEISAVTSGGAPGQAATIAGGAISDLLAGANACTKLQTGDKIIASLGTGADAVKAAQDFVAAEKNFNPFAQTVPTICSDPSLPSTAVLRGVLPLIDPAVVGSDVANKLSAQSLTTPFSNAGMSVAQIFAANGFTNFTTQDLSGNTGSASNASGSGGPAASSSSGSSDGAGSSNSTAASSTTDGSTGDAAAGGCGGAPPAAVITTAAPATTFATVVTTAAAVATGSASSSAGSTSGGANLTGTAAQQAAEADPTTGTSAKTSLAGVDFGLCVPTLVNRYTINITNDMLMSL